MAGDDETPEGHVPNDEDGPWTEASPSRETPDGRCGLTFEYEDDGPFGEVTCWRESWDERERCVWHADEKGKPYDELLIARGEKPERIDGVTLYEAELHDHVDFTACTLPGSDFRGAFLRGTSFTNADLRDAEFADADLEQTNFEDCSLHGADFTAASLSGTILRDATLHRTDFTEATLEDADLTQASLHDASFTRVTFRNTTVERVELNFSTTFEGPSGHEIEADEAAADAAPFSALPDALCRALGRPSTDPERLRHAEVQYRTIQRLLRNHDLREQPKFSIQEKHARRKRMLADREYGRWLKLVTYRWPLGYGERPWRIVGTSLVFGLVVSKNRPGNEPLMTELISYGHAPDALVYKLGKSFYFSVTTFTTLGYGDIQPLGWGETLAFAESFFGALLTAFLVFVLGRRMRR
jgi:uncharacterized protein YjbI with pentapeptide repeats